MKKPLRIALIALTALVLGAGIFGYLYVKTLGARSKARIIRALDDRFDADVNLETVEVSVFPHPAVTVEGLTIRHKNWNAQRPLISIRRVNAHTGYLTLFNRSDTVDLIRLEGLQIYLPRRPKSSKPGLMAQHGPGEQKNTKSHLHFLIKTIIADGTTLEIQPKQEGKGPLRFDIAKLTMHSGSPSRALEFKAQLTNPKPPGTIFTDGHFGPWERDDPRDTSLSGDYRFEHADLSVFNGIQGILSSTGNYHGVLERIEADGKTHTPDFALQRGGDPLNLDTTFHSIIDGTNGDTTLEPVDARLANSEFICRGSIAHLPGASGKTISLYAETKQARMEDILALILGSSKAMLKGEVDFQSKILIPQEKGPVIDKLQLEGKFRLPHAIFTNPKVKRTLSTFSLRARGIDKEEEKKKGYEGQQVASNLTGAFTLNRGMARFSRCVFKLPGATVSLTGSFNIPKDRINMKGTFRMEATLSETQSGLKHYALKILDPFFEKNGAGFQIPISISGTRKQPVIGASIFKHRITIR